MDWKKVVGSKKLRVLAVGAGALVTLGGAAAFAASLAPSTAVINACFDKNGALRYIDTTRGESCKKGETFISWNQQGPVGPAGVTGAVGATGATGRDGRDGLSGITGASGPTGATGPQGVQGPQGVPGLQGPQGPAGTGSSSGGSSDSTCSGANGVAYVAGHDGDLFLKLDDVRGESVDRDHAGEIEVQSFTWGGIYNTTSGAAGGATGKSHPCPVNVLKIRTDRATPIILQAAASGKHFQTALLTLRKSGDRGFEYAKYEFTDVIITSGGDSFNFIFSKVKISYIPQKPDGSADAAIVSGWDFASNTGI